MVLMLLEWQSDLIHFSLTCLCCVCCLLFMWVFIASGKERTQTCLLTAGRWQTSDKAPEGLSMHTVLTTDLFPLERIYSYRNPTERWKWLVSIFTNASSVVTVNVTRPRSLLLLTVHRKAAKKQTKQCLINYFSIYSSLISVSDIVVSTTHGLVFIQD